MILNVFERLLVRNIMPQVQGNFGHIREAREVVESLFTPIEEESLQIHIVGDGARVEWRTEDNEHHPIPQEKDVAISPGLVKKIAAVLIRLDGEERLTMEQYSLYEKFVKVDNPEKVAG